LTRYHYSGNNLLARVEKLEDSVVVSETLFVRNGFLEVQERDGNNAVTREYTWGQDKGGGIGGLLSIKDSSDTYYYLYDGKGNVSAVIDDSNPENVVASYRYDAFGNLIHESGTLDQPFRFSTKRFDENTGLYYYGYRYYSPSIGKWITRDPIGEDGGINLYVFVNNNAIMYYDAYGHSPDFEIIKDYLKPKIAPWIFKSFVGKYIGSHLGAACATYMCDKRSEYPEPNDACVQILFVELNILHDGLRSACVSSCTNIIQGKFFWERCECHKQR
jgi:RHS repeat-associated protein